MGMRETMEQQLMQQDLDQARRQITYLCTGMRNALIDLQDGDMQGAIETLQQFVGED